MSVHGLALFFAASVPASASLGGHWRLMVDGKVHRTDVARRGKFVAIALWESK